MSVSRRRVGCASLLAFALGACGISADSSPHDIDQAQRIDLGDIGGTPGESTGSSRIYVLTPEGDEDKLRSVARDVPDDPTAVLQALMAGPNETERRDGQLRTAILADTQVRSTQKTAGGVLQVDVSSQMAELRGEAAILAVAQIVFTASELQGVKAVRLLVEGKSQSWPRADGELKSDPLTVYDFPDVVESAEPDYPPVPSPSPA